MSAQSTVTTNRGDRYVLSENSIRKIRTARNGREAEQVFNSIPEEIPYRDRGSVWHAVDYDDLTDRG